MTINLIEKLQKNKVLPIIRSKDPQDVVNKAYALLEGGLDVMEINVESPQVFNAIKAISNDAIVCAGGIITSMQFDAAIDSGAKLISSPIFQKSLLKMTKDKRLPYIAGTSTANEAYNAWKSRIPLIKLFPTDAMGGVQYIEDILRQMPFLNLMPMGNIKLGDAVTYIKAGATAVGIGRDFYNGFTPKEITNRTREILLEIKDYTKWSQK